MDRGEQKRVGGSKFVVTVQRGTMARFYTGFFIRGGKIIACGNILKLGGSGGMLPQEDFEIYDL